MIYYLAILLIPLVLSFSTQRVGLKSDLRLALFFVLLLAFVGLRDQVGPDWIAYELDFQAAEVQSWSEIFQQREPGFFLLEKLASAMGLGVHGVNFMCALLFLSGLFMYARSTANPWLALAMVIPYLVFVVGMSGIRQTAAIGLMCMMLAGWRTTSTSVKVGLILLAMSIHSSAILLFVFLVWRNDRYLPLRLLVAGVVAYLSSSAITESAAFARYSQAYVEANVESSGAYAQVALSTFPALIYFAFRRQIRALCGPNQQVDVAALMAVAAFLSVPLSTTGVSRAALYLSFVQMWVYPAFVTASAHRRFAIFFASAISLAVFVVYFTLGSHASAYLPYESVLF